MRRLKRLALVIAHSLLLALAARGCFSPEVALAAIVHPQIVAPGACQESP